MNVDNVPGGQVGQDNNNKSKPNQAFQGLDSSGKETLLRKLGCLFGVRVDGNDGPRTSIRPVAKYKVEGQHHSPAWINEKSNVVMQVIHTSSERNTNFVHEGWSQIAVDTVPTWTVSRIAKNNQATSSGQWTTKRTTFQRLALDIPLTDLVPVLEFEEAVRDALDEQTTLGKYQALDRVFQFWGDVIPLVFDLGSSLTVTDIGSNTPTLPNTNPSFHIQEVLSHSTARIGIRTGVVAVGQGDLIASLANAVQPDEWVQARISRVVPVTELLRSDLKTRVINLYLALLSYQPLNLDGVGRHGGSFDGTDHAMKMKTISSIIVQCADHIYSLMVNYLDGSSSELYGGSSDQEHVFKLRTDEFVTEVVVWNGLGQEALSGIQFITSLDRVSPHYGGCGGTPTILNSRNGCLVAFCGRLMNHSDAKTKIIALLQTVWRHDTMETRDFRCSTYLGGSTGVPFNDRACIGSSGSGFIASIRIKCWTDKIGVYIESIQVEYATLAGGVVCSTLGSCHGGPRGEEVVFKLEPGEHITAVLGTQDNWIHQLGFVTNKGRASLLYGGPEGVAFRCQAPVSDNGGLMGLSHIMGKSDRWLDGLVFVWAPF